MDFFDFSVSLTKATYQEPGILGKRASEGPEQKTEKTPEQISGLTVLGCSFLKPFNLFAVDPPDSVQPGRFSIFTAAVQAKR